MKKIISAILAIAMLCSFPGCSNSGENTSTVNNGTEEASAAQGQQTEDGPLVPFEDEVTVKVMREFNSSTWYPEGESEEDNVLTRFYKDKLNINYEVAWKVERGQMDQQLNLAIASDDLPDLFMANANQIYRMAQAGQIRPITEAYENLVSDKVRQSLETGNKEEQFNPVTIDGELYGFPSGEDFSLGIPFIWVRQDWLDNLGITDLEFKTNQDIIDLAKRFMTEDPDGNGKDDTFGIVLDNTLDRYLRAFGHNIGQQVNQYLDDGNGTLIYTDIQPGMKDLLKLFNQMYNDGLLDKEFAVKDYNKATERLAAGEVGILPMSFVKPKGTKNIGRNCPRVPPDVVIFALIPIVSPR